MVLTAVHHPVEMTADRGGPSSPAFTLLELVVVVAIVGIVSTVALGRYADALVRYRLDLAARRIVADFELARREAKTSSASRTVVFNTATDSYQLQLVAALSQPNGGGADYTVTLSDAPYRAILVSANFGGNPSVVFNGFGDASDDGAVVVAVGAQQKTVVLDAAQGRAFVQ